MEIWRIPFQKLKIVLPHVILVVGTLVYTIVGAGVFYAIERPQEEARKEASAAELRRLRSELMEAAWDGASAGLDRRDWEAVVRLRLDGLVKDTFDAFHSGLKPTDIPPDASIVYAWTYGSALFFCTTVITTVGYGHLVPVTVIGRLFCVVYALLGIPLCLITIADIGKFVGQGIGWLYDGWKECLRRLLRRRPRTGFGSALFSHRASTSGVVSDSAEGKRRESSASGASSLPSEYELNVSPSLVLSLLLGYTALSSFVFWRTEAWTVLESSYFCFITMVTVGFGDLVPSGPFHLPLVVFFIFSGLMLTTISIDLVGTHYINKLHYFGRNIGDWWKQMKVLQSKYGLTDEEMRLLMADAGRRRPFVPSEAALMSYIDNVHSLDEAASLISCLDL